MRTVGEEYEAWFRDVGSTRPDNYDPPRIHIGTPHEDPVVLTRQDWRHAKGRPWGSDSNGYWALHAASPGQYEIRLRFPETEVEGQATLEMGTQTLTTPLLPDVTECTFYAVPVRQGNLHLQATLAFAEQTKGPWQVDVFSP